MSQTRWTGVTVRTSCPPKPPLYRYLPHCQSSHHCDKSWWACPGGQGLTEDGGGWEPRSIPAGTVDPLVLSTHGPTHPATRSVLSNIRPLLPRTFARSFHPPSIHYQILTFLCVVIFQFLFHFCKLPCYDRILFSLILASTWSVMCIFNYVRLIRFQTI